VTELSGYELEPIREGADFTLYRGWQHGNSSPVLAVAYGSPALGLRPNCRTSPNSPIGCRSRIR
jgi:hypothetical protein